MMGFVTFEISGDKLDFDDLSENLHIQPTNIYKKGDTSDNHGLVLQAADRWIYEVEFGESQCLNKALSILLSAFSNEKAYFNQICKQNSVRLWCDLYSDFKQFGFVLHLETVSKLVQLGLDIEFHCFSHGDTC